MRLETWVARKHKILAMHMHIAAIYVFYLPNFFRYPAYKSSIKPCDFISSKNTFTFFFNFEWNPTSMQNSMCFRDVLLHFPESIFLVFTSTQRQTYLHLHETYDYTRVYNMQMHTWNAFLLLFLWCVFVGHNPKERTVCVLLYMPLLHKNHDDFSGWCNIFISTVKAKEPQGHKFSRVFFYVNYYTLFISVSRFTSHELMVSLLKCVFVKSSWPLMMLLAV